MPEKDQLEGPLDGGDGASEKKRTSSTDKPRKTQEQTVASAAGTDSSPKKVRATREDKGIPRLEPRDLIILRWMLQMYAVRFDQLQVLLARHSPKQEELTDPEHVSPSTVRTHLRRWKALGLVTYKKILADKDNPLWCWLTPHGLNYLAFEEDEQGKSIVYSYYLPKPRELTHLYLINQARLYIERYYPAYIFKSERQLRREQSVRPKAIKQRHLTDGLIYRPDGKAIALEVERWDKAGSRLKDILQELAQTYHRTWYFVSKPARTAVTKAHAHLPESLRSRIQILSAEAKLLGLPSKKEDQEEEAVEE
ncbi:MAG: hypothetical protein ACYDER_07795 [Ktedonobacteraceae bacterium]